MKIISISKDLIKFFEKDYKGGKNGRILGRPRFDKSIRFSENFKYVLNTFL